MVDQQPGDTTPAAVMPDPTRFAGSDPGEPPTAAVPGRWSGAAMVPAPVARRSRWSRLLDRFTGSADGEHDDRTAVPAVDPWADQETPVWAQAYTTPPAGMATAVPSPPTRLDEPTAFDSPAPHDSPARPTRAEPPTRTEPGLGTPTSTTPARDGTDVGEPESHSAKAGATPGQRPLDRPAGRSGIPAPGTYPPSSAGTGLPPKIREWSERAATEAPEKLRAWSQQAATKGQQAAAKGQEVAAKAPGKLRSWRRQAATVLPRRQEAPRAAARGPVQPHIPLGRRRPEAPWSPPAPPKPRRRMRKLRRLVLLLIILVGLVTGGPYIREHVPGLNQYPVTAALPDSFADLTLRDTAAGEKAARQLAERLQEAGADGDGFAGVYSDARGKRVTVFGVTGLRLTPGSDLDAQLSHLSGSLKLKDVQTFDVGELGAHQRCGTGRLDGTAVVACGWADHGSLVTVLLTRRSVEDSADLVTRLRDTVLTPS